MLSLIVDYRPTTNACILGDVGHTNGKSCMGEIGKGKKTKTFCTGMNIDILNCLGPPWEGN
jgi:hypothetical protein